MPFINALALFNNKASKATQVYNISQQSTFYLILWSKVPPQLIFAP